MKDGRRGLALCDDFHRQVVAPLVSATDPDLPYAAALIGAGSEVLGFDDVTSTDHDWAPRLQLFVPDDTLPERIADLVVALDQGLPETFGACSVRIGASDAGAGADDPTSAVPDGPRHRIDVTTLREWATGWFGRHLFRPWTTADWLATPQQRMAGFTAGAVFHDAVGDLTTARGRLAWYPDDVWRYLLACQWQRVAQLEPFTGRTGDVGDDLGSRVLAASLVRDAMGLAFLIERRYAPYPKWFGSAFARLPMAATIGRPLDGALRADGWRERERLLAIGFSKLIDATNLLGLAAPVDPAPRAFYDRPYTVVGAENVRQALGDTITDPAVRAVIDRAGWVGGIDQVTDNVDLLTRPDRIAPVKAIWDGATRRT